MEKIPTDTGNSDGKPEEPDYRPFKVKPCDYDNGLTEDGYFMDQADYEAEQRDIRLIATLDSSRWRQGAIDGFHGRPVPADLVDDVSYASGHAEGKQWCEWGEMLDTSLEKRHLAREKSAP